MSTALAAAVQEKAGTVVPALMPFIRPEMAGLTPIAPPRHIVGAPRFLQVGAGRKVAGQNASAVCGQLRFAQLLICQLHHGQRFFNMRAANARLRRWRLGKGAGLRRFGFAKTAMPETALTLWPLVSLLNYFKFMRNLWIDVM